MACRRSVGSSPIASTPRQLFSKHCSGAGAPLASRSAVSSRARVVLHATPKQPPFRDGSTRLRFGFSVSVATRDRPMLEALHTFLGVGSIRDVPPARPGHQPISVFRVGSLRAHHAATIPSPSTSCSPAPNASCSTSGARRCSARNGNTRIATPKALLRAPFSAATSQCEVGCCAGVTTTVKPDTEDHAAFLAGFVAAEGTFVETGNPPRYRFAVGLARVDRATCEGYRRFLRCGSICDSPRRRAHYDDESAFAVQSIAENLTATIPFMDAHLPPSYKRTQYLEWRAKLLDYWEHKAKRVRPCTVEGCDTPRRAHGLCRHHLYRFREV